MPAYRAGRHELGQNFLIDRRIARAIVNAIACTEGPIIEIGAGDGALTLPLEKLGRPLTGIEIDMRHATRLRRRVRASTRIVNGDFLRYSLPREPHVLAGNLPFHQTTAMLRRILHSPHWTDAVLLVQWEVARRRAGVGGATMMTAQAWPWFEFELLQRVPASAFTPQPAVDGGLLTVVRRSRPLVPAKDRRHYSAFVHAVFSGKGRGIKQVLTRVAPASCRTRMQKWLSTQGLSPYALPRDLTPAQWAELYALFSG